MKKRGRPALPKSQKRARMLRVLVTPDEERQIKTAAKAADRSLSNWLRAVALRAAAAAGERGQSAA